jgi:hypothetical protein
VFFGDEQRDMRSVLGRHVAKDGREHRIPRHSRIKRLGQPSEHRQPAHPIEECRDGRRLTAHERSCINV